MMHNYPAYVFRLTSLLEKLGIKAAIYVHKDEVSAFCNRLLYRQQQEILADGKVEYKDERVPSI